MTTLQSLLHRIGSSSIDRDAADRRPIARAKQKAIGDNVHIWKTVRKSQTIAQSLSGFDSQALRHHTDQLRTHLFKTRIGIDQDLLALAAAGVMEAVKRVMGFQLFDVQLFAAVVTTQGAVAEMQTGEGKTLAGVLPAYFHALAGRGVHVATTNGYLATRDHESLTPIFGLLGLSTGLVTEESTDDEARHAYDADVTFGPGYVFGFDFLKDQLTLAHQHDTGLGSTMYRRVNQITRRDHDSERPTRGRGLHCAIIDEIDNVLIDDAISPLVLSESMTREAPDAMIHQRANSFAKSMDESQFRIDNRRSEVSFSETGYRDIYAIRDMACHPRLVRPWHEYIALALRAIHCFHCDVDYVIGNGKVQIVDASTGRVFVDRTWSRGLHQAVLANHQLPITSESKTLARITRQRLFRHYKFLAGMTGTAAGCEKEFSAVYGLPVIAVPLRVKSKRRQLPDLLCVTEKAKWDAILDEVKQVHDSGRAVLIGTSNIQQSQVIAERLRDAGLTFALLNGIQDADEASIVAEAGQRGAITVATNLAGRGTDIRLDPVVARCGGLHVIVAQHHTLARVDRQLLGRCARCGDPGSARVFIAADESWISQSAPWISRAIVRHGEQIHDAQPTHRLIANELTNLQKDFERRAANARWQMLKHDLESESMLRRAAKQTDSPSGCWQLS